MFHWFHPGLACNRRFFATQCRSLFLKQRVPQWHYASWKASFIFENSLKACVAIPTGVQCLQWVALAVQKEFRIVAPYLLAWCHMQGNIQQPLKNYLFKVMPRCKFMFFSVSCFDFLDWCFCLWGLARWSHGCIKPVIFFMDLDAAGWA